MKEMQRYISDDDKKMVAEVKAIAEKGSHAEVKKDRDGNWIIYEVSKKRKMIG